MGIKFNLSIFIVTLVLFSFCKVNSNSSNVNSIPKNILLTTDDASFNPKTGEFVKDKFTVGLWHFNEGKDQFVFDSSGNNNDGVITGGSWSEGIFGKCVKLTNVGDYISIENSPSLNPDYAFTVEGWVNISEKQICSFGTIIIKLTEEREGLYPSYALWLVNHQHKFFEGQNIYWWINLNEFGEEYDYALNSNTPWKLLVGDWHYFAGTYDGKVSKIYIDGELKGERKFTGPLRKGSEALFF
ncbi:MAG: LamG domain-containing protein, partial [Spirochaetota bacterium]|nr:LamG domain-containing protein [Spirochaetota bacterium]